MRSVIESEMPLIVAIQHSKSGMFSKFHFTCFEWIIQGKLFYSPSFNLKNLCAAGTEEGPILLISKLAQSVVPVCLLCVHKRKVSDIIMSHQLNTFLSVSIDGSIAGWHCSDGSCCFAYDNLIQPGEIKIVLCESDTSLAWFWTRGYSASLVDLKRGAVSQKIDLIGLSSFAILKKSSNFLLNTSQQQKEKSTSLHSQQPSFALMAGINTVRTYQIDEKTNQLKFQKSEEIVFSLGQKYHITSHGIVITKKNLIKIFLPNINIPIYSENINEISDDDMISSISWKHPESLIINSFKGIFKIYKVQIRKNESTQRISITSVNVFSYQNCYIFSNVAYNTDIGYAIFSASKSPKKFKTSKKSKSTDQYVICLSMSNQKAVELVLPPINKICCIPDASSRIVIQAEQGSTTFQIFDWGLSTPILPTNSNNSVKKAIENITIDSSDYKSSISRSFFGSTSNINSSSEIRNYSLFGKQFPLSQSVDFRPNLSQSFQSAFVMRSESIGNNYKKTYITAITCQNFNNLSSRLQIIVGASDGKLYFFWENNLLPFEISEALISPVIAIVLLPIKFTKASCLIAIGKDGSFCLFKWNKMSHRYISNYLPIVAVGLIKTQRLIVIQKSDDSFSVYDLKSPEPISIMLAPPPKTVFIWSTVNSTKPTGIQSTLLLQINGNSLFYSVLEVSKLKKTLSLKKGVNNYSFLMQKGEEDYQESSSKIKDLNNTDISNETSKSGQNLTYISTNSKSTNETSKSGHNLTEISTNSKSANETSKSDQNLTEISTNSKSTNETSKSGQNSAYISTNSKSAKEINSNGKSSTALNLSNSYSHKLVELNSNATPSEKALVSFLTHQESSTNYLFNASLSINSDAKSLIADSTSNGADIFSDADPSAKSGTENEEKVPPAPLTKSSSSTSLYPENSTLVRKVNTESSSDSNGNSDSANEFYPSNRSDTLMSASTDPLGIASSNDRRTNSFFSNRQTELPEKLDDRTNNFFSNRQTGLSEKLDDRTNSFFSDRQTELSEKLDDSTNNFFSNRQTGLSEKLDDSLSKISIKSKQQNAINSHSCCFDPISQSGRFTSTEIKNIVCAILEMMVPTTSAASTSVESTCASKWYTDNSDGCLSFALVGHKNMPTFFYPMFKLSGPSVFDTSPFNAAVHYLSYKIMSNFLRFHQKTEKFEKENKFKICGFISILTQLLFVNDPEIQRISADTCNRIVNWPSSGIVVPEQVWNLLVASYIQYFDKNDVADYDKFLMGIMMVTHADLVDPIYHKMVFNFLKKIASDSCPSNYLAFSILVASFDFWAVFLGKESNAKETTTATANNNNNNSTNETKNKNNSENNDYNDSELTIDKVNKKGKKELLVFLLKTFFGYEKEERKVVKEKLYETINDNFTSFCESIRFILSSQPTQSIATEACQICSEISEEHPRIGRLGPLFIAYLSDSFPQLGEVFFNYLKELIVKFKGEFVNLDQFWLFASNDGFVHVFKNMRLFFQEKVTDGPMSLLSIGPNAAFAAVVTENDPTLIKIDLRSTFFLSLNKKRVVDRKRIHLKSGLPFENMKIVWDNKESCHVEYY